MMITNSDRNEGYEDDRLQEQLDLAGTGDDNEVAKSCLYLEYGIDYDTWEGDDPFSRRSEEEVEEIREELSKEWPFCCTGETDQGSTDDGVDDIFGSSEEVGDE